MCNDNALYRPSLFVCNDAGAELINKYENVSKNTINQSIFALKCPQVIIPNIKIKLFLSLIKFWYYIKLNFWLEYIIITNKTCKTRIKKRNEITMKREIVKSSSAYYQEQGGIWWMDLYETQQPHQKEKETGADAVTHLDDGLQEY